MAWNLNAQSIQSEEGVYYKGPMKLTGEKIGASLWLPIMWQTLPLSDTKVNKSLVLVHENKKLHIEIYPNEFNAVDAIGYLQTNVILPTGELLTPTNHVEKLSPSIYRARFNESSIDNHRKVIAYIILGPQHRSLSLFGFYETQDEHEMNNYLIKFVTSISFTPTKLLPDDHKRVKDKLSGGRFVYYSQEAGYSLKKEIWLCSDQRYFMQQRQYLSSGTWRVQGKKLIFKDSDASESSVDIEVDNNAILFNGIRVYRLGNRKCR